MREEEAIVSLGAVCISLYQCAPAAPSWRRSTKGAAEDHRGDVLVPFRKGGATYGELAGGVEYRLNQYFVLHPRAAGQQCSTTMAAHNAPPRGRNGGGDGSGRFNGSYFCPRCTAREDVVCAANVEKTHNIDEEYPRIVVRNFTRARQSALGEDNVVYEPVDENMEVTESNLCCFFYCVKEKCTKNRLPVFTKDGGVKRPLIRRDHVCTYSSESAYGDSEGVLLQHIELKVGERLFRIGTSAEQRFEDVFQRLKRRNLHVRRLFDGATGASILPCELVRHLSWKVSALCADIFTPLSVGVRMKRRRGSEEGGKYGVMALAWGKAETSRDEKEEEVGTLISLSQVTPDACGSSTVSLTLDARSNNGAISPGDSEERHSWRYEQLLQKTTFGFDDSDDTVPLVDVLSTPHHVSPGLSAEAVDGNTPLRSFYLGDDTYSSCTHVPVSRCVTQGIVASTTPVHEDCGLAVDSTGPRSERCCIPSGAHVDISPIMVTQQSLPDFFLDSSEEEEEEEEDS